MSSPSDGDLAKRTAAIVFWAATLGTGSFIGFATKSVEWAWVSFYISVQVFSLVQLGRNRS